MNIQSDFQKKFPLSGKKYTKKMVSGILSGLLLSSILALVISSVVVVLNENGDANKLLVFYFILFFTSIFIFYIFISSIYWKVYIKRYYYDCGTDFITICKNVFTPSEIHVQYLKIQDVYVDQDLFDRFLGIYDVHISSATVSSGIEAHIDGLDEITAESIKNFLLNAIKNGSNNENISDSVQIPQKATVQFNLTEDISDKTYPISQKWIIQKIVRNCFIAFIISVGILVFSFSPGKNGARSLADTLGFTFDQAFMFAIVLFILVWIIKVIFSFIWKNNYKFNFLPEYIFVHSGVINIEEQHIPYDRIQDVMIRQGFIEKILGLSSVYIQNATTTVQPKNNFGILPGIAIPGQSMERSQKLSEIVRSILIQKNQKTGL